MFLNSLEYIKTDGNTLYFIANKKKSVRVQVCEKSIFRFTVLREEEFAIPNSWAVAPGKDLLPPEGVSKKSIPGFSYPPFQFKENSEGYEISTDKMKLVLNKNFMACQFYRRTGDDWILFKSDRTPNAYKINLLDGISHFVKRIPEVIYYGLGEKTGELSRTENKYEMRNLDAMDYDPDKTDPLYKHIPFYLAKNKSIFYGVFYDNFSNCHFDFGRERENYYGFFTSYTCSAGDLDYYVISEDTPLEVVKCFSWMTGKTFLPPKYSLKYSGSTMGYTESDKSEDMIRNFISRCEQEEISCGSFQLSSGYCMHGKLRQVFVWNKEKFPNFKKLADESLKKGVRFSANIKPVMFPSHPDYAQVFESGGMITNNDGSPHLSHFWDGSAAHIDFTSPEGVNWWKKKVKSELLDQGVSSTWNDNNEFHLSDEALSQGLGNKTEMKHIKPVQTLLMLNTSYSAHIEHSPNIRPWLITRAGMPGLQRYAQTWTGDNRTSFRSLKMNIKTGLSLSLSGIYNWGIDIGGFSGPAPSAELLLRWVQQGIFYPRCTIHSWNSDGTVTEPWMHKSVLPQIRSAFQLREELLPYLYSQFAKAHFDYEPIVKPLFLDFPDDPECYKESDSFLFGSDFFVHSIVDENIKSVQFYLPKHHGGWFNYLTGEHHPGGETLSLDVGLDTILIFVKGGAVVPFTKNNATEFKVFAPPLSGSHHSEFYNDDGESFAFKNSQFIRLKFEHKFNKSEQNILIEKTGSFSNLQSEYKFSVIAPKSSKVNFHINSQKTEVYKC